jgi:ElaA protein
MKQQWQTLDFAQLGREQLYDILQLRQEVFVIEQDCVYLDLDGLDQQATHILCTQGEQLLAYQRCLPAGVSYAESSLGRIVVAPAARGLQLGRELVQRGIDYNLKQWPGSGIRINAQAYLRDFYAGLGFVPSGKEYEEDGIMHQQMVYDS